MYTSTPSTGTPVPPASVRKHNRFHAQAPHARTLHRVILIRFLVNSARTQQAKRLKRIHRVHVSEQLDVRRKRARSRNTQQESASRSRTMPNRSARASDPANISKHIWTCLQELRADAELHLCLLLCPAAALPAGAPRSFTGGCSTQRVRMFNACRCFSSCARRSSDIFGRKGWTVQVEPAGTS